MEEEDEETQEEEEEERIDQTEKNNKGNRQSITIPARVWQWGTKSNEVKNRPRKCSRRREGRGDM